MATKQELLKALTAAGVEGYSKSDSKPDLEEAAAAAGVDLNPPDVTRNKGV